MAADAVLDLGQVHRQIVGPEARPLADGRGLGRLEMGEAQAGQIAVLGSETGQRVDHRGRPPGKHLQSLAQQQQIGVVGNVATRGPEMDNCSGVGALVAVGVNVGHHVMPQPALVPLGCLEVDVVQVGPELLDLLPGDGQAQFGLGLGQGDPQPPPGAELPLRTPQPAHLRRGIAGNQRIVVLIGVVGHDMQKD